MTSFVIVVYFVVILVLLFCGFVCFRVFLSDVGCPRTQIPLPLPPKHWDERHIPPLLGLSPVFASFNCRAMTNSIHFSKWHQSQPPHSITGYDKLLTMPSLTSVSQRKHFQDLLQLPKSIDAILPEKNDCLHRAYPIPLDAFVTAVVFDSPGDQSSSLTNARYRLYC